MCVYVCMNQLTVKKIQTSAYSTFTDSLKLCGKRTFLLHQSQDSNPKQMGLTTPRLHLPSGRQPQQLPRQMRRNTKKDMRQSRSTPYIGDGHPTINRESLQWEYKPPTIGFMTIPYHREAAGVWTPAHMEFE